MVSFAERTLDYYIAEVEKRADKSPTTLDRTDVETAVRDCIRKLDQIVSYPRILIFNSPPKVIALPDDVEQIVNVKFSNEMLDPFVKEFGLMLLFSRVAPMVSMENATEFLMLKGNLNTLARHLKFAPDWAYYPPNLVLNGLYRHVVLEYLPVLDGDSDKWVLNSIENTYIVNRSWALFNMRNAEALIAASFLGVGNEYQAVLTHWDNKLKEIDDEMKNGGVITYLG